MGKSEVGLYSFGFGLLIGGIVAMTLANSDIAKASSQRLKIEVCEAKLPRDKYCHIIAVPEE